MAQAVGVFPLTHSNAEAVPATIVTKPVLFDSNLIKNPG